MLARSLRDSAGDRANKRELAALHAPSTKWYELISAIRAQRRFSERIRDSRRASLHPCAPEDFSGWRRGAAARSWRSDAARPHGPAESAAGNRSCRNPKWRPSACGERRILQRAAQFIDAGPQQRHARWVGNAAAARPGTRLGHHQARRARLDSIESKWTLRTSREIIPIAVRSTRFLVAGGADPGREHGLAGASAASQASSQRIALFRKEILGAEPASHMRFNIFPGRRREPFARLGSARG